MDGFYLLGVVGVVWWIDYLWRNVCMHVYIYIYMSIGRETV